MRNITTIADDADGIGQFSVVGVLTPAAAASALAENDKWVRHRRLGAQVVSYRCATLEVDAEAIRNSARSVIASSNECGLVVPTALLVSADHLELWCDYCWMMAQLGIMRAAFVRYDDARQWAEHQARLVEAQAVHRSLWRSRR